MLAVSLQFLVLKPETVQMHRVLYNSDPDSNAYMFDGARAKFEDERIESSKGFTSAFGRLVESEECFSIDLLPSSWSHSWPFLSFSCCSLLVAVGHSRREAARFLAVVRGGLEVSRL